MKYCKGVGLVLLVIFFSTTQAQQFTTQQKIEDFEYMFSAFEENYPYFGVLEREHEINWLANKTNYLNQVKESKNDTEFITAIKIALNDLHSGHTDFMPTFYRSFFLDAYAKEKDDPVSGITRKRWREELEKGDNYWAELFGVAGDLNDKKLTYDSTLLSLEIIEEGNIAALKIASFSQVQMERDSARIYAYLNSVKDYQHLIIDIQDNTGGDARYWRNNIVPLLIDEEIEFKNYLAIRNGKFIRPFLKEIGFQKESFKIAANLKELPGEVNERDFYLVSDEANISPKNNIGFKGKIHLLVNNKVYSSAEGLAVFCKATRWATVVGETTGGDGIGVDPIILCLPHSKILIRFPSSMGLNPNGSSNEEKNTVPDVQMEGRSSEERLYNLAKTLSPNVEYVYHDTPPILNDCKADVVIYPTHESSDSLNTAILNQVKSVNDQLYKLPDSLIIPDTIALVSNLQHKNVVCVGSVNGNLWTKKNLANFPIEITPNYIKAKAKHEGDNLSLITSWFNGKSEAKYVCFYTAQKSEGIIHINYIFHGPTSYVIAGEDHKAIEKGNFKFNRQSNEYEVSN